MSLIPINTRTFYQENLVADMTIGVSSEIDWSVASAISARIIVPAGQTYTVLTFHHTYIAGGTYYPLHTKAGVAVAITVSAASKGFDIPAEVLGCLYWKVVATTANGVFHLEFRRFF